MAEFLDLNVFSFTLAGVSSGIMRSFDPEDVTKLFHDTAGGGSEVVQLFVIQYFLYSGVLEGLLVDPVCLLTLALPLPLLALIPVRLNRRTMG
ncbi:MAG: hypothetical protein M1357_03365 [Candidatus Marsarchaeota archaeon]|nr:hypothetical protein [Candidatus Marsarchaeota archaeon]